MRVLPFLQCKSIPYESLVNYECSDRLLVAKNILVAHNLNHTPCILQLTNPLGLRVVGTVMNTHSDTDIIYMPSWMLNHLKTTQHITLACVPICACTKLVIKPYNKNLFEIKDWYVHLRNGLRLYSTLTHETTITINIDGLLYFSVEMLYPQTATTIYVPASDAMEIDIQPSFEYQTSLSHKDIQPSSELQTSLPRKIAHPKTLADYRQIPYLFTIPLKIREQLRFDAIHIFGGTGHRLGGTPTTVSAQQAAYDAALIRRH